MRSTGTTRRTTPPGDCPFEVPPLPDVATDWQPALAMAPQFFDWTCSSCALDWVLRATAINSSSNRYQTIHDIGYPDNINPQYGLMDAEGGALRSVYEGVYGYDTAQGWLSFDEVYALAQRTTGQMSGAAWYHWVSIRGVQGPDLWIANSAPGYKGVSDILSRADFERLGPFSVVYLLEE